MTPPNILSLEAEVLANILEYVDDESPHTTAAVARTCKYFNFATKLVRYRRITVRWDAKLKSWVDKTGRKQEEWETPELLQGLRQLTVCKGDDPRPQLPGVIVTRQVSFGDMHNLFGRLETVLRNASNLKTLAWKVGYLPTDVVVKTLQTHQPNAKLEIFRARRLSCYDKPVESEKVLAAATCLNSFSMTSGTDDLGEEDRLLFHMILRSAPNLRFASIISFPARDSYSPAGTDLPHYLKPWFPPDLQRKQSSSLRHLTLDGWGMSADGMEHWSQYVKLACLESLKCSRGSVDPSFFERAPEMLTNLKSFGINLGSGNQSAQFVAAANTYIATCPPLQTLSLWSWRGAVPLSTILSQHGATLQDLQLHECDDPFGRFLRDSFSTEELQSIRQSCPRLKILTFDLNRVSAQLRIQDYKGMLDELRKFNLDKIQIYLDLGLRWLQLRSELSQHDNRSCMQELCSVEDDPTVPLDDIYVPSGCFCDSQFEGALPLTVVRTEPALARFPADGKSLTVHPPSTHRDICRFLIKVWKTIFGSNTSGPRQLELKFGEWEKKYLPAPPATWEVRRDIRVFCRARPHERDDMIGECFVELYCCGGKHHRKFSSR